MADPSFFVMSALAQSSRWRVFELLLSATDKGLLQGEIAAALGVSKNLLSSHLKIMQAAGLVSSERNGREITYRATPQSAHVMATDILNAIANPNRRVQGH
ncbi:metalloregulator ArsR/SmtB family transcription factor [Sphingomonas sp. UYEF23]|uniref:ArsR/SmtB family transcription factor n=1 Tax=Sphingomonas sp. UYEF23 TaxID=1756408 RepID=UPI0033985B2A